MSKRARVLLGSLIVIITLVITVQLLMPRPALQDLSDTPQAKGITFSDVNTTDVNHKTDSNTHSKVLAAAIETKTLKTSEDHKIQQLLDPAANPDFQKVRSLLDNPVHPGRVRLQEQMRQETMEETFSRLADNDSMAMLIPIMGGQFFATGLYSSDVTAMCKMTCVRKLLADARTNPKEATAFLIGQLQLISKDFPLTHKKFWKKWKENSVNGLLETSELPDPDQYRLKSTAAVYILSEINAYESLPIMAQISNHGKPRHDEPELVGTCLVNRKFAFYAMHKLVSQFPEESLSKEAAQAKRTYLVKAKDMNIPDAARRKVASWDAYYHEDDFRRMLPGKKLDMSPQTSIELSKPPALKNLTSQDIEDLLMHLREFTRLAFPDCETSD